MAFEHPVCPACGERLGDFYDAQQHTLRHVIDTQRDVAEIKELLMSLDFTGVQAALAETVTAADAVTAATLDATTGIQAAVDVLDSLAAKLGAGGSSEDQGTLDEVTSSLAGVATGLGSAASKLQGATGTLSTAVAAGNPTARAAETQTEAEPASAGPAAPADPHDEAPVEAPVRPVYQHVAPGAVDTAAWSLADVTDAAGGALYWFSGDTDGTPHGAGPEWAVYGGTAPSA